jgi:hypothetical protein
MGLSGSYIGATSITCSIRAQRSDSFHGCTYCCLSTEFYSVFAEIFGTISTKCTVNLSPELTIEFNELDKSAKRLSRSIQDTVRKFECKNCQTNNKIFRVCSWGFCTMPTFKQYAPQLRSSSACWVLTVYFSVLYILVRLVYSVHFSRFSLCWA